MLNSLPKLKFHFFLHQLIKRRNRLTSILIIFEVNNPSLLRYTEWCHQFGKYPLLPSAKKLKEQSGRAVQGMEQVPGQVVVQERDHQVPGLRPDQFNTALGQFSSE